VTVLNDSFFNEFTLLLPEGRAAGVVARLADQAGVLAACRSAGSIPGGGLAKRARRRGDGNDHATRISMPFAVR
jgi:hypothetical protein